MKASTRKQTKRSSLPSANRTCAAFAYCDVWKRGDYCSPSQFLCPLYENGKCRNPESPLKD